MLTGRVHVHVAELQAGLVLGADEGAADEELGDDDLRRIYSGTAAELYGID